MRLRSSDVLKNDDGSAVVEFVTVFFFFMLIVFLVLEVALALFWWKTAEKAAFMGARAAVVSTPAVNDLPVTNDLYSASVLYGTLCSNNSTTCADFGTHICDGGSGGVCDAAGFASVLATVQSLFGPVEAENLTVEYKYVGLGFAGGPPVPLVTVTIHGVAFQTGFLPVLARLLGSDTNPLATMPDISGTLTGEDLNSAGG